MITKEQAVYLMELVDTIGDASASMGCDSAYRELRAFVASITETNE